MNRDYALGARIKSALKAAGFKSARAFALQFNIPYLTIAQHIQGRRHPHEDYLKLYSKQFGVNIEWLRTGEGSPLASNAKASNIVKLSNAEVDKRLDMYKALRNTSQIEAVNETLLSAVVKALLTKQCQLKNAEAEKFAKGVAFIYNDIANMDEDQETQLKMVKAAANVFLQQVSKK